MHLAGLGDKVSGADDHMGMEIAKLHPEPEGIHPRDQVDRL